jgi:stringent starvation protein B
MAVQGLNLADDFISFSARFSGQSVDLLVPTNAVLAIYARENGQGMMFNDEPESPGPGSSGRGSSSTDSKSKPSLRVVK